MDLKVYGFLPKGDLLNSISSLVDVHIHEDLITYWEANANTMPPHYEMAIISLETDGAFTAAILSYALYRKQIPVLLLCHNEVEKAFQGFRHDLLTVATYKTVAEAQESVQQFVRFPAASGRIFTFEGGDGAGKQTQTAMLVQRLQAEGYPVRTLDFPHDHAMHGALIREVLSGKFGKISEVNPLLFASIYAFNRLDTTPRLRYWLKRGYNVVLDRYSTANWGHQASKYDSDEERLQVIETLDKFEHQWLGLPKSFRVFYLDLPPDFALQALKADTSRASLDIHETAGTTYKNRVRDTFLWCCQRFTEWTAVPCVETSNELNSGSLRVSREALHNHLYALVQPDLVNRNLFDTK